MSPRERRRQRRRRFLVALVSILAILSFALASFTGLGSGSAVSVGLRAFTAPTGVACTTGGSNTSVSWTGGGGETSYEVQRSPAGAGSWTTIASPASSPYTDSPAWGDYQYRVRGVVSTWQSGWSTASSSCSVQGNLDLASFSGIRIDGAAAGDSLGPRPNGAKPAGDVNGDGWDDVIVGAPTSDVNGVDSGAAYVNSTLTSGITYRWRVVAVKADGVASSRSMQKSC
jgi:hypothetical protein